mgnify:CR=1 FL=1
MTSNIYLIGENQKACFFLIEDGLYGVFIQSRNQYESKFMTGDWQWPVLNKLYILLYIIYFYKNLIIY